MIEVLTNDNWLLTVGTFLAGKIHVGDANYQAGRAGDPPSITLSHRLRELPFTTWMRLHRVLEGSSTACVLIGDEPLARPTRARALRR